MRNFKYDLSLSHTNPSCQKYGYAKDDFEPIKRKMIDLVMERPSTGSVNWEVVHDEIIDEMDVFIVNSPPKNGLKVSST